MAGGKSEYLERLSVDIILGAVPYTPPATVYFALSTAAFDRTATGSAMNEVTNTTSYIRASVSNDLNQWPLADAFTSVKTNASIISFPAPDSSWGTVMSWYLVDAPTDGNVLYGEDLSTPQQPAVGVAPYFNAGAITITEKP